MTIKYVIDHIPRGTPCNRRPAILMVATTLTIHNTGNPMSTAKNERGNLTNPSNKRQASFHIVVDEHEAIECLPLNENAWHSGDGSGMTSGNRTSIGIELCESGNYSKTLDNAVELAAKLLKQYGWGVDRLRRHYDWSGKICPRLMYSNGTWEGWAIFKSMVTAKMQPPKAEVEEKMELTNNQWDQLGSAIQSLLDKGIITDKAWIDKIKTRKLTISEISWLNTIVLSRK